MKKRITNIAHRILHDGEITLDEAMQMIAIPETETDTLEILFQGANQIREQFAGKKVDLCTIMNAKSGKCSEDCKFCAQSAHYHTDVAEYSLIQYTDVLERAKELEAAGAHRFSLVTSGKGLSNQDFENILKIYHQLRQDTHLKLCASHGIISYEQAVQLKEAGVTMYHHNLETSPDFYPEICTTHTLEERIETIKNVQNAGLDVCSGGIIGLGESREDRIKMAFAIKELQITSIPINVLNPIQGTPLGEQEILSPWEILKTMAIYRYILPNSSIRYAGGRAALQDLQQIGFQAGVNAALVGNYLTTVGSNIETDKQMIHESGLEF